MLNVNQMSKPDPGYYLHQPERLVRFTCNLCTAENVEPVRKFHRELATCLTCYSNVRFRSIVDTISTQLFGTSLMLPDFPISKNIRGIGLSDAHHYASFLSRKLGYTNTYYHQEPMLDIMNPDFERYSELDFIISSDVFEHVPPPAASAFENSFKLLKEGGFLLLTVPYQRQFTATKEHYPDLHDYEIYQTDGEYHLKNITSSGEVQLFSDLVFHGGPGSTLELRHFAESDVLEQLEKAGFSKIQIVDQNAEHYGIVWKDSNDLPILAIK